MISTVSLTKARRDIGQWIEYGACWQVQYIIDWDYGIWWVAHEQAYPYFKLQQRLKARAYSLLATVYGLSAPPIRFRFRYDVKLDAQHVYRELIGCELDAQGRFLPSA